MTDYTPVPAPSDPSSLMQDFIFGVLEADEGVLQHERQRWSGLRHGHAIQPLHPQPHQPVQISVTVGPDVLVDRIAAYVTCDGSDPAGHLGQASNGFVVPLLHTDTRWQPLLWDYVEIWQGEIPEQPWGTHVRYRIQGWRAHEPAYDVWSQELTLEHPLDSSTLYGYSIDNFATPAWALEAVVYHIFVDRFAPAPPYYLRPSRLSFFCGGNLQGVLEQLDYIVELGVTAIWLSPIFKTHSYHGYDVVDYYEVDPHFGDKDDLRALIAAAHVRGLRIILDFVANHTSTQFAPFQEALHDPDSPYRPWFSFSPTYKHGYRCFFDVPSMPQLDLDHPQARAYILDAACYWLREFDVDGYRLDYAAGPSHDFWTAFRLACKQTRPDCWLFGEVTLGSDNLRTYTGRLDGCLDFNFTRQIRKLLCSDPPGRIENFANSITRTQHFFPRDFTRPTFLENH
ncbi:MAG: alpha-amylase, partial [Chloroflexi bacterium]|nr:alpha-amylase [Chloroflexota bacterium]